MILYNLDYDIVNANIFIVEFITLVCANASPMHANMSNLEWNFGKTNEKCLYNLEICFNCK